MERQIPSAERALELLKQEPKELPNLEKAVDDMFGKEGPNRDEAAEMISLLLRHGVKKGSQIYLSKDSNSNPTARA
jgi:hypothetical protein